MSTPRLGRGPLRCAICNRRRSVVGWCDECRKSHDRHLRSDDGTVLATVLWAARRARRFARLEAHQPTLQRAGETESEG